MDLQEIIHRVRGGLIVSCQALEDEPLFGAHIMARMALAAQIGGAVGIRSNSPQDVKAIKEMVGLPVIGLYKEGDSGVYITPTLHHAREIAEAGADVIAIDATARPRPDGMTATDLIRSIKHELKVPVLADISTLEEARIAEQAGADFVAPTLSGYTDYSPQLEGPDFQLIRDLVMHLRTPIIGEGRIRTPHEASEVLRTGVLAVVVGSAITRPQLITAEFVRNINGR